MVTQCHFERPSYVLTKWATCWKWFITISLNIWIWRRRKTGNKEDINCTRLIFLFFKIYFILFYFILFYFILFYFIFLFIHWLWLSSEHFYLLTDTACYDPGIRSGAHYFSFSDIRKKSIRTQHDIKTNRDNLHCEKNVVMRVSCCLLTETSARSTMAVRLLKPLSCRL